MQALNEDIPSANESITQQLNSSVANGDLTALLKRINATASFSAYPLQVPPVSNQLRSGAIAGIVLGSAFLALMGIFTLFALKRRRSLSKTKVESDSIESLDVAPSLGYTLPPKDEEVEVVTGLDKKERRDSVIQDIPDMPEEINPVTVSTPDRSIESSSVVSSTGWSSSAGLQSFASNDLGITIDSSDHSSPLDDSDLEFPTPQVLEDLINSGDWAGVMQAATKFEPDIAVTDDHSESSFSNTGSSNVTSSSVEDVESSIQLQPDSSHYPSAFTSNGVKTLEEIRSEVESLVRRVVPGESDNIDEMLFQFEGREEELVENLRRMLERQVAKKARIVSHMDAKLRASSSSRYNWKESFGSYRDDLQPVMDVTTENEQAVDSQDLNLKPMTDAVGILSDNEPVKLDSSIEDRPVPNYNVDLEYIGEAPDVLDDTQFFDVTDEHDAVLQAQMWTDIGTQGALDAADWAIARSLSALNTESADILTEDDSLLLNDKKFSECESVDESLESIDKTSL